MNHSWICLIINSGNLGKIEYISEIRRFLFDIFGKTLRDFYCTADILNRKDDTEDYVFAKIDMPNDNVHKVRGSLFFDKILRDEEGNLVTMNDEEIEFMRETERQIRGRGISKLNVVRILDGIYRDLYGVVLSSSGDGMCDILIKLFTRTLVVPLSISILEDKGNLVDILGKANKNVRKPIRRRN